MLTPIWCRPITGRRSGLRPKAPATGSFADVGPSVFGTPASDLLVGYLQLLAVAFDHLVFHFRCEDGLWPRLASRRVLDGLARGEVRSLSPPESRLGASARFRSLGVAVGLLRDFSGESGLDEGLVSRASSPSERRYPRALR